LEDKLAAQKQIRALEATRNQRRKSLFDAQDQVDKQREELIANIEGKLVQNVMLASLFAIQWVSDNPMPTNPEKVAQIDIALRARFFAHVPQITRQDRAGWNDDQHDTDRLSRSLAAYALVGMCEIEDMVAAGAITDGTNDGGIDALYFDRGGNRLLFVQSKFKRNGAAASQEETLKTINGIKALQERRFDSFNQAFQDRIDEIEEALDTPGVRMEVALVFLGEHIGRTRALI